MNRRKQYLNALAARLIKKVAQLPEEMLYIIPKNGKPYFYYRDPTHARKFTYLRKDKRAVVRALVQKQYLSKLLEATNKELDAIDLYLSHIPSVPAEEVYETFEKELKGFIVPEIDSDMLFEQRWAEGKYVSLTEKAKKDDSEKNGNITDRGEHVRSKSECLIANMLNKNGIPYKYEKPLMLNDFLVYPDFTILDVCGRREIFLEHLGKMDDVEYLENAIKKIIRYSQAGYHLGKQLFLTMETHSLPLNLPAAEQMILQALSAA